MLDLSHLTDSLNPQQREAVTAPSGNLLVLAGAGSGKTKVLTHRFAWLMEVEKISPQSILAVTFTNKAANEMRERLNKLLHLNPRSWWVGTFHGLAHRWLRQHWQEANLPQAFQILDSDDQLRIIKKILKELNLDEKLWQPPKIQAYINRAKDQGVRPCYMGASNDYSFNMRLIYDSYQNFCEKNGFVDFGELLLRVYEMWYNNSDLLAHYQQCLPYILVDEFQDTNTIQYAWLKQLIGKTGYAFVVGDDDQSIYGWRGAESSNIQRFQREFSNVQLIRLEQNYRSSASILSAANALIEKNTSRMGKKLWTNGETGEPIGLFKAFDEEEEARFIGERIRQWVGQNKPYKDCAILYRSNVQSRVIERTLIEMNLPYRVYDGLRFFERQEIKDALAYLRLLNNLNDDGSFERAIAVPPRGIGDVTMEKLRKYARQKQISLWKATEDLTSFEENDFFGILKLQTQNIVQTGENHLSSQAINLLRNFLLIIIELRKLTTQMPLYLLVETVLNRSGLLKFYQDKKGEKEQARADNLKELINATVGFEIDDTEESPLLAFLNRAALEARETQSDPNQDAIQLMTLHSSKGLEFGLVFISACEKGLIPHSKAIGDDLEEERRLFYVGITRAKQSLFLTYSERRRYYDPMKKDFKFHDSEISPFIENDIPAALIEPVRFITTKLPKSFAFAPPPPRWIKEQLETNANKKALVIQTSKQNTLATTTPSSQRWSNKPRFNAEEKPRQFYHSNERNERFEDNKDYKNNQQVIKKQAWIDPQASFKVNQKVQHEKFGIGIVLANEGKGDSERVYVDFGKHGKKWLVLSFAKLQSA